MPSMWPETKQAVRKALWVCETLLSLPLEDYRRLLDATAEVRCPLKDQVRRAVLESLGDEVADGVAFEAMVDDEMAREVRHLYSEAAVSVGLEPDHGIAVLEYAALLKDLGDE